MLLEPRKFRRNENVSSGKESDKLGECLSLLRGVSQGRAGDARLKWRATNVGPNSPMSQPQIFFADSRRKKHNSWPSKPKALGTKQPRLLYIIR